MQNELSVPAVDTSRAAPSDAIVLFDGTTLDEWQAPDGGPARWTVDGRELVMNQAGGDLVTKRGFGDCQLHVEWLVPADVAGVGQERGNSGVFLQQRYEIQILDSYDNPTYADGLAGALYRQAAPLVNASRPPGHWQAFDIVFRAPRFDMNGRVSSGGFLTVLLNGVLIQDHTRIRGRTGGPDGVLPLEAHEPEQPLTLQAHRSRGDVRFRNIWIRRI